MDTNYRKLTTSRVTISELMLPSHTNFSGKIHGGYILMLMDQIAFAAASKYSGCYCVTASVDKVDFLNPIEVGELVTMKASVNYVGNSSMVVGIRVISQNIQTEKIKHCNSSYFTMVGKDENGNTVHVPRPVITSLQEVRRFHNAIKRIELKKQRNQDKESFDHTSPEALEALKPLNIKINL
ncbi:MAG: acyl-CoA thioesterase [Flavobacterium sp. MedPE-SWcel]|uniref:acyl-CoA thioesterase n=1 Tax=uncultured Flavobacterium sp. TaxID=165435 RepID=UPI00090F64E2|nr:acyl-CoA thioesterase [uncultured Flavobacterium sp.]OIQ22121.1 MAG: acyl-CoA thioesterase [Flavobacterium sp. MedPE-SWcel]